MAKPSKIHLRLNPEQVRAAAMDGASMEDLTRLGIGASQEALAELQARQTFSMDSAPGFVLASTVGTPIQFLQHIMPQAVQVVTAARKADDIAGRVIAGNWHDEEIVQPVIEPTGQAGLYSDLGAVALANYNVNYVGRTVVRFEEGTGAGVLQKEQAQAAKHDALALGRIGCANALHVSHNNVAFFGYNNGANKTYGLLNDPFLPAYKTAPNTGNGNSTKWRDKGFMEIVEDLRLMASALRVNSGDLIDPEKDRCTLSLPTECKDELTKTNDHGLTVGDWLKANYPNWRVVSAPELTGANGGLNVAYLHAQEVPGWDENGKQPVIQQLVPAVLRLIGIEKGAKGDVEVYSSATAGCLVTVPYGVCRMTGV